MLIRPYTRPQGTCAYMLSLIHFLMISWSKSSIYFISRF
uniref:Uncharacterized protein n=1 Tax=Rhizophora mucronata TaxID=61149 RepID=A0A2P2P2M1_RHIMU